MAQQRSGAGAALLVAGTAASAAAGAATLFVAPAGTSSPGLRGQPPASRASEVGSAAPYAEVSTAPTTAVGLGAFVGFAAAGVLRRRAGRPTASKGGAVARGAGTLADCPYTIYGTKDVDVAKERKELKVTPCPIEVRMPEELKGNLEGQQKYFEVNLPKIYKDLKTHGAIVFRGFELSKEAAGFQKVGESLELERCEDPLHSVAARDAVNKEAGVYEAVNKQSRRKFYVGMHNEMVGNRAPGAAIFVCFKAADEGGEFLVADGRKMFKELDEEWLKKCYDKDIRYSTAEFPMGILENLGPLQGVAEPLAYGALSTALKFKVDFDVELLWEKSEYDGSKILQVRAMPQAPIVRHPFTGEPAWWGSMHSHSEYLRSEREKVYGEEGFAETTGSSRINKTDVYYADSDAKVENDRLKHLDEVTMKSAAKVRMEEGDMVLLDNYLVMHGRCPFEGTRKHAVTWYKSPDYTKAEA